jgi:hypothetical protein
MANTDYIEYTLSINSFNKPTVLNGRDAIGTLLIRLILLEPGTNPLHPTMGVGLISKYRFLSTPDLKNSLLKEISNQVKQFIPFLYNVEVKLDYQDDKTVDIMIYIDNTIYVYDSSNIVPITLETI